MPNIKNILLESFVESVEWARSVWNDLMMFIDPFMNIAPASKASTGSPKSPEVAVAKRA